MTNTQWFGIALAIATTILIAAILAIAQERRKGP